MASQEQSPVQENYSDTSVKLRDLEEKQSIIKDRVLLIGENLVSEKEDTDLKINELKAKISGIEEELRRLKLSFQMMIDNVNNLVRKNEFEILKRQFEMFQPLDLARITDVESMIEKALKRDRKS